MFTKRFGVAATAAMMLMLTLGRGTGEGATINYFVEFEASGFFSFPGVSTPPIDLVAGSFSFTWDDRVIPVPPRIVPLDAVSLSIGHVTYDVTTAAAFTSMSPDLFEFGLVGKVNGIAASSGTDDFLYFVAPDSHFSYSVPFSNDLYFASTVSQKINVTPVPEPGSLMLLAIGGGTWLVAKTRRRPKAHRRSASGF